MFLKMFLERKIHLKCFVLTFFFFFRCIHHQAGAPSEISTKKKLTKTSEKLCPKWSITLSEKTFFFFKPCKQPKCVEHCLQKVLRMTSTQAPNFWNSNTFVVFQCFCCLLCFLAVKPQMNCAKKSKIDSFFRSSHRWWDFREQYLFHKKKTFGLSFPIWKNFI